jgi:hypothetical protein
MNCSSLSTVRTALNHLPATEAAAARRLPALLEPAVARKLLLTAVTRHATHAIDHLLQLTYMRQQLDAATLEAMLHQPSPYFMTVRYLCRLPEAAQLSVEAVSRLLLAAVDGCNTSDPYATHALTVMELCRLSAAANLSSEALFQVLQVAVVRSGVPEGLYMLPAAQQLRSDQAYQLLLAAITSLDSDEPYWGLPREFYQLPAVQQLSSEQVQQLLQAAVAASIVSTQLFQLPAAADISGEAVLELLHAALKLKTANFRPCIAAMLRLPGFGLLKPEAEFAVLRAAYERFMLSHCELYMPREAKEHLVILCCALPAAKQLSLPQMTSLLLAVLKGRPALGLQQLCSVQTNAQHPEAARFGKLSAMVEAAFERAAQLC